MTHSKKIVSLMLASALILPGTLAIVSSAQAQIAIGITANIAPPPLPVYVQPPLPAPGYLWTPGYWGWGAAGYYWVPGVWVRPPVVGLLWTPGYWGFAGVDGAATTDTMTRLGREAAGQAAECAHGPSRSVDLAPTPVVTDATWTMPVEIDPFTVSYEEKADVITGMADCYAREAYGVGTFAILDFIKETRTLATSEGTFCTQTVFNSGASMQLGNDADWMTERGGNRSLDFLSPAGAGWEYILRAPYQDRLSGLLEDARRSRRPKPAEIGRYDVVFDATTMAGIIDRTIGAGTELERAMGYQANDGGTSFLDDPLAMLGSYQLGSPHVTVTANRSLAGGAATVKWDAEGVEAGETPLVTKGILTDFQTTRESASWLAPYYQKAGRPVRSSGGAGADEATSPTRTWPCNFTLAPDPTSDATFESLVANVKRGYAFKGGSAYSDFQCLNGWANGDIVYEIVDGKLGSTVDGEQIMFRAPELFKNVAAVGGARSAESIGVKWGRTFTFRRELQLRASINYTVRAVPAHVTQLALIDMQRKA